MIKWFQGNKERKTILINLEQFEDEIKKNKIANSYVFCGLDEELIKESINSIVKRTISKESLTSLEITSLIGVLDALKSFAKSSSLIFIPGK